MNQRNLLAIALLLFGAAAHLPAQPAPVVQQLDPYWPDGSSGVRCMPDIEHGGEYVIPWNKVIDVVILGDGYLMSETNAFFADAENWYESLFGSCAALCGMDPPCGTDGIVPYTFFPQAFRVRAVFVGSAQRASTSRGSHYRVKITTDGEVSNDGWWNDAASANVEFRIRLASSMNAVAGVGPPFNPAVYPGGLNVVVPGDSEPIIHNQLANMYSHTYVVMLVRADYPDCSEASGCPPSGRTRRVEFGGTNAPVNVAFASNEIHEFGHAFAYLEDEYISERGRAASRNDPAPEDRSVFLLSNLTYTYTHCGNSWAHIAPSGIYNPDPDSLVGNLYRGGEDDGGVWHSEYRCLMNGKHENYACNLSGDFVNLRDYGRLCFWCEEIVTLRILEKSGQLTCSSSDLNDCGREWFANWNSSLRHLYYTDPRFDNVDRIAARSTCYAGRAPCGEACDGCSLPACLSDCAIRDHGNAAYVESSTGLPWAGTRLLPFPSLGDGIQNACGPRRLVLIRQGSYPGPYTLSDPARLSISGCTPVRLGE